MAKQATRSKSAASRRAQSARRGSADNIRPLQAEDFNTRPSARDNTFRSFYEEKDSYEPETRTARPAPSGRRTASKASKAVRGRRTGVLIQEKKASSKAIRFSLPKREESDFTIIACVVLLSFIGLIMVTSSSYYYAYTTLDDSMFLFRQQCKWIGVGALALIFAMKVPLRLVRKYAKLIYFASVFFSFIVIFVGTSANGSTRWLGVGSLSFQPAELAKIGVALYMAVLVEEHQNDITDAKVFAKLFTVVCIPTALVAYQNLSSGIIIACIGVVIMFVGGARWKHFFCIVGPILALVVLVVVLPMIIPVESLPEPIKGFMEEFMYRTMRVQAWLNPFAYAQDEGYQIIQSMYAVASGGFFGRGLGQSIQKLGFIPEAYNDIIFSIICEELGMFGAIIVIALFAVFTWHGIKISLFAPNKFTSLVSAGIVGQIAVQAILNIAVNTNSIPATGISLPFISYGGSSMLFLMISVGILLNISGYTRKSSATR